MSLQTNIRLLALFCVLAMPVFVYTQDIQPQAIQFQVMPEPTVVYTCGEDFQPVDIEFDSNGNLFITDRQFLNGYNPWYNPDTTTPEQERINSVYRYQKDTSECQPLLRTTRLLSGLTTNSEGAVCFVQGGFFEDLPHPYFRLRLGYTFDNEDIEHTELVCIKDSVEVTIYPRVSGIGDIVLVGNDIWATSVLFTPWQDLSLNSKLTRITKRKATYFGHISGSPSFLTRAEDSSFFTGSYPSTSDKTNPFGNVTHLSSKGESLSSFGYIFYPKVNEFLIAPTGVKTIDKRLLIADYKLGQLHESTFEGKPKQIFTGLQGPMGITQTPNGDICIAEMRGARVSCYSLSSLGLE